MSPRAVNLSGLEQFTAINLLGDLGDAGGPVIVPSCAQIILNWNMADGKQANNVMYGRYSGQFNGSQAQCNAILTALATGAQWTAMAAFIATTASLGRVLIRDVNTRDQAQIVPSVGGGNGTSASPELPNEVAICVTLRTALVGRRNRGRAYLPGWATNALATGNVIAPAVITAVNAWANTIPTAFAAQGYTFVIGQKHRVAYTSPITGNLIPDRPATSTPITTQSVRDNHWDSQRRRGLR